LSEKSEYQIMDEMDSQQIVQADTAVKQALVYVTKQGKPQLSYMGVKWLVLKMSQAGQALEIPEMPQVILERYDPEDRNTWVWYATVKCRNAKTGLETIGTSEQPFIDALSKTKAYDSFGRTKAVSKAERNAYRKQIPELEIQEMMKDASMQQGAPQVRRASQRQDGGTGGPPGQPMPSTTGRPGPTQAGSAQAEAIRSLGYDGAIPESYRERHALLERLASERRGIDTFGGAKS